MSLPRAALLSCMLSLAVSLTGPAPARAEVTLLIPSRTVIDAPAEKKGAEAQASKAPAAQEARNNADNGKEAPAETAAGEENKAQAAAQPAPPLNAEVDMLISLMRPREHAAQPMDMPQLFAVLRHDAGTRFVNGTSQPERRDLLGDMEESLYLDTKAWGANVAIDQPGLYQFITETRPRLNAERQCFEQQYVKSILPVCGVEDGWERPAGLRLEILPLTRPFGLTAGSSFTGKALGPDGPLVNARVYMDRIRTEKSLPLCPGSTTWKPAPTPTASSPSSRARPAGGAAWWKCPASPSRALTASPLR